MINSNGIDIPDQKRKILEKLVNPFVAKSCVLYLKKAGNGNGNQDVE